MKLKTKLTLFNAISKLVIAVLFVLLVPFLIKNISRNYVDNKLIKQKSKFLQIVKTQGIKNYIPDGETYGSYYLPLKEEYLTIEIDTVLGHFIDTIRNEKRLVERDTIEYRILSHTFKVGDAKYLLEIGKSVATLDETSTPLQNIAFVVLIGMILLTILADQFYTNRVLRPLGLIIKSKLIGHKFPNFGSYKEVKTSTSDFKHLDISIHQMIETIEAAFQKEREFISNASHELMTPISILQSKIENMFEREDIIDELKVRLLEMQKILNRLKSITKTLLLISQIENEQFLKEDKISITELLQEVYDEISVRLPEKNLTFDILIPQDVIIINVNRFLIFNLFFNLVNNAIKYNKPDGEIVITTETENDNLIVNITDSGIGISTEDMPFIFNRFKKFRQSMQQDSFGLGLPIVKSIAAFHDIKIEVDSVKDLGSNFRLIFPSDMIETSG
ncbi:sensor histidine kinase KdpD [Mucilaginibacter sp. UR6-11]|uniref:sensor histidine kinase n=1 Tax=Mucilaginibacter sp. UR6-11 TaxID=1435644 RepID=UPI001E60F6BA|nr:HAMP domain-containing sensor histidine kinase [Mucilaginibacter sp. UR6-11]MCC8427299.1 HAMP domain-containing histidine kinase [Mucilaginibacter sp. UR6-11]